MNAALGQAGIYNRAKQKQISAWAEIGTKATQGHRDGYNELNRPGFPGGSNP
jgi:hypothetical protein